MKDTVKYILGLPDFVEGIGLIFPIRMINYDDFMNAANIICLSYDHFQMDEIKKMYGEEDIKLLDLIAILSSQTLEDQLAFVNLNKVFSYILKKEVIFNPDTISFDTKDGCSINRLNYDEVREVIMKQNLLFTPKVYKNKKIQEWAEKVLKARAKNSIDSTIEDMISTIAAISGKDYNVLATYTIYQIRQEFNRIMKIESYRNSIAFMCAGGDKAKIEHYAENINMFKNPYDDIFKEKNSMQNINSALQGS